MQHVETERLQSGCVRFSYLTPGSTVPRRFRCEPDLALLRGARELYGGDANLQQLDPDEQQRVELSVRPRFTSMDYGDPAYAQLDLRCREEIRTGAEDGSEMGVFSHLKQPQREGNIRVGLNEYLRFGMEAGIFFVN